MRSAVSSTGHSEHEALGQHRPKATKPTDHGWKSLKPGAKSKLFLLSTRLSKVFDHDNEKLTQELSGFCGHVASLTHVS